MASSGPTVMRRALGIVATPEHRRSYECRPPDGLGDPRVHGFISKCDPAGRRRLGDLHARAHVLIGPSGAEACAVAFAEACCYGVPVLATDTWGVSTIVRAGVTGYVWRLGRPATRTHEAPW